MAARSERSLVQPRLHVSGGAGHVSINHAMRPDLYVTSIWVRDQHQRAIFFRELTPQDTPDFSFSLPEGASELVAHAKNNRGETFESSLMCIDWEHRAGNRASALVGNNRAVAVVGAGSFVGMHLVQLLLQRGLETRGVIRDMNDVQEAMPLESLTMAQNCRGTLSLSAASGPVDGLEEQITVLLAGCDLVFILDDEDSASSAPWVHHALIAAATTHGVRRVVLQTCGGAGSGGSSTLAEQVALGLAEDSETEICIAATPSLLVAPPLGQLNKATGAIRDLLLGRPCELMLQEVSLLDVRDLVHALVELMFAPAWNAQVSIAPSVVAPAAIFGMLEQIAPYAPLPEVPAVSRSVRPPKANTSVVRMHYDFRPLQDTLRDTTLALAEQRFVPSGIFAEPEEDTFTARRCPASLAQLAPSHVPHISVQGEDLVVSVKPSDTAGDRCMALYVRDESQNIVALREFAPGEAPMLAFPVPVGRHEITAYARFSKHGKWSSKAQLPWLLAVTSMERRSAELQCVGDAIPDISFVSRDEIVVSVGHEMITDHHVEAVWICDEFNSIVAFQRFEQRDTPVMRLRLSGMLSSAASLRVLTCCTKHGVVTSPPLDIAWERWGLQNPASEAQDGTSGRGLDGVRCVAVTGATSYTGVHLVKQLMERGFAVHGTTRDASRAWKTEPLHLQALSGNRLSIFEADIDHDNFEEELCNAFQGCDAVFHLAGIHPSYTNGNGTAKCIPDEIRQQWIDSAVKAHVCVVRASKACGVKRIVFQNTLSAVLEGHDVITEACYSKPECYNDPEYKNTLYYSYMASKCIAEREAVRVAEELRIDLRIICAGNLIVGPVLANYLNGTTERLRDLLLGRNIFTPMQSDLGLVDVQDVVDAELQVMFGNAPKKRYLVLHRLVTPWEIICALREIAPNAPLPVLDDQRKKDVARPLLHTALIQYRPTAETLRATVLSLVHKEYVPAMALLQDPTRGAFSEAFCPAELRPFIGSRVPRLAIGANGRCAIRVGQGLSQSHEEWVTAIYARDQSGRIIALHEFDELEVPKFSFALPTEVHKLRAFARFQNHGTWCSTEYDVEMEKEVARLEKSHVASTDNSSAPVITFGNDGMGIAHMTSAPTSAFVYIRSDLGAVVAFQRCDVMPAALSFMVPSGAEHVVAYAACNGVLAQCPRICVAWEHDVAVREAAVRTRTVADASAEEVKWVPRISWKADGRGTLTVPALVTAYSRASQKMIQLVRESSGRGLSALLAAAWCLGGPLEVEGRRALLALAGQIPGVLAEELAGLAFVIWVEVVGGPRLVWHQGKPLVMQAVRHALRPADAPQSAQLCAYHLREDCARLGLQDAHLVALNGALRCCENLVHSQGKANLLSLTGMNAFGATLAGGSSAHIAGAASAERALSQDPKLRELAQSYRDNDTFFQEGLRAAFLALYEGLGRRFGVGVFVRAGHSVIARSELDEVHPSLDMPHLADMRSAPEHTTILAYVEHDQTLWRSEPVDLALEIEAARWAARSTPVPAAAGMPRPAVHFDDGGVCRVALAAGGGGGSSPVAERGPHRSRNSAAVVEACCVRDQLGRALAIHQGLATEPWTFAVPATATELEFFMHDAQGRQWIVGPFTVVHEVRGGAFEAGDVYSESSPKAEVDWVQHVPILSIRPHGNVAVSVNHAMREDDYVKSIWVRDQVGRVVLFRDIVEGEAPVLTGSIAPGTSSLVAFAAFVTGREIHTWCSSPFDLTAELAVARALGGAAVWTTLRRIAVVGVTSFIGAHLGRELVAKGYQLNGTAPDGEAPPGASWWPAAPSEVAKIFGADPDSEEFEAQLRAAFDGCGAVVVMHAGGVAGERAALRAAMAAGVARVVLQVPSADSKSVTTASVAADEFGLDLRIVCSGDFVLGPANASDALSPAMDLLHQALLGHEPEELAASSAGFADVRDVVRADLEALSAEKGTQRPMIVAREVSPSEIWEHLRTVAPHAPLQPLRAKAVPRTSQGSALEHLPSNDHGGADLAAHLLHDTIWDAVQSLVARDLLPFSVLNRGLGVQADPAMAHALKPAVSMNGNSFTVRVMELGSGAAPTAMFVHDQLQRLVAFRRCSPGSPVALNFEAPNATAITVYLQTGDGTIVRHAVSSAQVLELRHGLEQQYQWQQWADEIEEHCRRDVESRSLASELEPHGPYRPAVRLAQGGQGFVYVRVAKRTKGETGENPVSAMYVRDQRGRVVFFKRLAVTDTPVAAFTFPEDMEWCTAYAYSDLRGLSQGGPFRVDWEVAVACAEGDVGGDAPSEFTDMGAPSDDLCSTMLEGSLLPMVSPPPRRGGTAGRLVRPQTAQAHSRRQPMVAQVMPFSARGMQSGVDSKFSKLRSLPMTYEKLRGDEERVRMKTGALQ